MNRNTALSLISNDALNHRSRCANRIAYDLGQLPNDYAYRPTLLELVNERRARKGLEPITNKANDALLPPGGTEQLRKMARDYRRKARRARAANGRNVQP